MQNEEEFVLYSAFWQRVAARLPSRSLRYSEEPDRRKGFDFSGLLFAILYIYGMRLPLIREAEDKSSLAWWDYALAPIAIPFYFIYHVAGMALLLVIAGVAIPFEVGQRISKIRKGHRLKGVLSKNGRCISWDQLKSKLDAGKGTLICVYDHHGPMDYCWWCEEDLIAAAPFEIKRSLDGQLAPSELELEQSYLRMVITGFLDENSGRAKFVYDIPSRIGNQYPLAKVLNIHWRLYLSQG